MSTDLISGLAVLEQPGGVEGVLIGASELPLLAEVQAAADQLDLSAGAFAVLAVRRFMDRAGDEDWVTLTSR
ncbi:MAG: hypothetical protein KKB37_10935, partial [Alphaproteobacteria bacterium]|nr:hypothetical protein [Alphaproteobacteria bacterium]